MSLRRSLQGMLTWAQFRSIIWSMSVQINLLLSKRSSMVSPSTSGEPLTKPKNTLPTLKMSDLRVMHISFWINGSSPVNSGGFRMKGSMKPGVPQSYLESTSSVIRQAIPKSARHTLRPPFTLLELFNKTFSGFISRCTMFL